MASQRGIVTPVQRKNWKGRPQLPWCGDARVGHFGGVAGTPSSIDMG
jgi:hypothetical protein